MIGSPYLAVAFSASVPPTGTWDEVLSEVTGRTKADLDEAITLYVEKVAQVQYLQDSILR